MNTYATSETPVLTLGAKTAADLMVPHVVCIPDDATVQEAVTLLTDEGVSALPVLDESGDPVGVVSLSDIVAHNCEKYSYLQPGQEYYRKNESVLRLKETKQRVLQVEQTVVPMVGDIMTPVVFSVARNTPASTVVDAILALGVHRLFVTDEEGEIVGVISTIDVLRHLHQPQVARPEPSDQKEVLCGAD
jgi:CBS-domain-containing membrane protein